MRVLVFALVTSLALALAACTGDEEPAPSPTGGDSMASVDGFPGLYYDLATVSVVAGAADQLSLIAAVPCAELDAMLSAGQWRVADRMTLPPTSTGLSMLTGMVAGLLLERAGTLAFVAFEGQRDYCAGTVTTVQRDGITVAGKGFPEATPGWAVTTTCIRYGKNTLTVSVYFDTSARIGGVVTAPLVEEGGKYTVDGHSDDLALRLIGHTTRMLEVFGASFTTGVIPPGVTPHILEPGESFTGAATVEGSSDRPQGTITMSGLTDPASGELVSLSLPFACADVLVIKA